MIDGWYLTNGRYYVFSYPGSIDTQALGVNESGEVVGTYEDANKKTHGFLLPNPQSKHPKWQTIDALRAAALRWSTESAAAAIFAGGIGVATVSRTALLQRRTSRAIQK